VFEYQQDAENPRRKMERGFFNKVLIINELAITRKRASVTVLPPSSDQPYFM